LEICPIIALCHILFKKLTEFTEVKVSCRARKLPESSATQKLSKLFAVKLYDQLLVDIRFDVFALGQIGDQHCKIAIPRTKP
jgi:hypothetical protein